VRTPDWKKNCKSPDQNHGVRNYGISISFRASGETLTGGLKESATRPRKVYGFNANGATRGGGWAVTPPKEKKRANWIAGDLEDSKASGGTRGKKVQEKNLVVGGAGKNHHAEALRPGD